MSLKKQLEEFNKNASQKIPPEVQQIMHNSLQRLEESHITDNTKKAGDRASDFTLPNAKGDEVSLNNLLDEGPVVLSFYRGNWCPYCNLELKALQDVLPEIENLGAKLVAVSPQIPDESLTTVEKNELKFEVLSDVGNKVASDYGLVFELDKELRPVYDQFGIDLEKYNGNDKYELPIPSTYVIDADGTIIKAHNDTNHTKRMEPSEIVDALKQKAGN